MRLRASFASALFLLVGACASDDDAVSSSSSVTKTVGPEGGVIEVGGATVTIPAGALAEAKPIVITATDQAPPPGFVALSKVFECGPTGTTFAVPVTMKMPFVGDAAGSTMFWSSGEDPTFKDVGGQASNGFMTATVRHFSSGFVGKKP